MQVSPEELTVQWYESPEAVLRAFWKGPAEAEGLDVDELLAEGEGGGLTFEDAEVTFTTAEQLEGMREQGCWGFVDTNSATIHAWADPGVNPEMLIHFLAHEVGHKTGEPESDSLREELRAELYGSRAAIAFRLMQKRPGAANG